MMCEHEFICPNCNGNGYLELHAMGPEKCNVCRGKGAVQSMPTNLIANLEKALLNDLYQQLAAAKAELAAIRNENELLRHKLAGHDTAMLKAELAELKEYQSFCPECGSKNIFSPTNRTETGHLACRDCGQEFFTTVIYADCIAEKLSKLKLTEQRAEQAEAQCAAMQTAINRYVFGNIELLDALKAALGDKP